MFRLPSPRRREFRRPLLCIEELEAREVPTVNLLPIADQPIPNDRPIYIPVTVTNTPNGPVNISSQSSNSAVTVNRVLGGRSVRFDVSYTDTTVTPNVVKTGSLTIRLFEDVAPLATGRIIDLVNSGYYNNKLIHRVIDGFVIQGGSPTGNGVGGSGRPSLPDEYNRAFTFASLGIVAMANAGDDGNDAQFFITDLFNRDATTQQNTLIPLSSRPQTSLNFNHSIVGILTEGFDDLDRIIRTAVQTQDESDPNAEVSRPVNNVTITGATVFDDTENAVLRLTTTAGFTGTSTIQVSATDFDGPVNRTFTVTGQDNTSNSRAFLGALSNLQTTTGQSVSFTVPFTDIDGDVPTFAVRNAAFTGAPSNVGVQVEQATGRVTLTPAAGFTGTVQLKVGVRDPFDRTGGGGVEAPANYDTQLITLTVNAPTSPPTTNVFTATGAAAGAEPRVTVKNQDGSDRFSVLVYEASFTGGVRTAIGDVNGDGTPDVIVVPAEGGAPLVKVLDSTTGNVIFTLMVFENTFRGGLYVDVGDSNNLGYAQVLLSAGNTGGPRVTLFDVRQNRVLQNFFAGDSQNRGGVFADLGQVIPNRGLSIVTGLGPTAGPVVAIFDAQTGRELGRFIAGDPTDRTGIRVKIGDLNAAGTAHNILVGAFNTPEGTDDKPFDPADALGL